MSKKIKFIDKEPPITEHSVLLTKKNQPPQKVRKCGIDIKKRFGLFSRHPQDTYELSITSMVPDVLILGDAPLLYVEQGSKKGGTIKVDVESNRVDFLVFFDPNQVLDCKVKQSPKSPDTFCVSYIIEILSPKGLVTSAEGSINIKLNYLTANRPDIWFTPNEVGNTLTYSLSENVRNQEIGFLCIKHSGNLLRFPSCNLSFDIIARTTDIYGHTIDIPDLITLGGKAPTQSNPRINETPDDPAVVPVGKDPSDFRAQVFNTSANLNCIEVNKAKNGIPGNDNEIHIPVFWNMTKAWNPEDSVQDYLIFISGRYANSGESGTSTATFYDSSALTVHLNRNKSIMDIEVSFKDNEHRERLLNGQIGEACTPLLVAGGTTVYTITLRNTAEVKEPGKEDAKIYIRNFKYSLPDSKNYKEINGKVQKHLFKVSGDDIQGKDFSIGIAQACKIDISYDHTCIEHIEGDDGKEDERTDFIGIDFEYYTDADNRYSNANEIPAFIPFHAQVPINMQKAPKPEWLCVDFGTSAIVASRGNSFYNEHGEKVATLIDLKLAKQKFIRSLYKEKNAFIDNSEVSSNLISSAVVVPITTTALMDEKLENAFKMLDNRGEELKRAFETSPIWLSPTSGMIDIYTRMLPSLKSLMGAQTLAKELLPDKVTTNGTISVDALFMLVYKQFFKLFLPEDVKDTNKLILTVPNTYAPAHINKIKHIARAILPCLRSNYIRFISESDAIAFYYLSNRSEYLRNSNILHLDNQFDKRVLVYDMGAGTLDLTYFTQETRGEKKIISIEGKMGVSKAGNYLDYLIAEILVDKLSKIIEEESIKKHVMGLISLNNFTGRDADAASKLKEYVRNTLKPLLNKPEDYPLPALTLFNKDIPTSRITVGDIVNDSKFKEYLKSVSEIVFKHFKSLFDKDGSPVCPDLVIFSGRTTCLTALRIAVRNALATFNVTACRFLDLSKGVFIESIDNNDGVDITNLKTAVVDGALAFCSDYAAGKGDFELKNKNVYAQYGIMFKTGSDWHWEQLIDTHTIPINDSQPTLSKDGFTIYEYDSSIHDADSMEMVGNLNNRTRQKNFSSVSSMYVLQSYSQDTIKDWIEGKRDMISVIGYADMSNVDGVREYKLTVDKENQVNLFVGSTKLTLLSRDDNRSDSFRKSIWPIVR